MRRDKVATTSYLHCSSLNDIDEQHYVQGAPTSSIISSVNVTADNENLNDAFSIKNKMAVIDIYPTVLQRMDIHHRIHQPNMSVARQLSVIEHDHNYHAQTSEVKEERVEDKGGGIDEQQCIPATSTRAVLGRTNVVADSVEHSERVHIKEELEDTDLDIGPSVLQHMDSYYRTDQINMNGIKVETRIMQLVRSEPELPVKEEIVEDDWQDIDEQHYVQGAPISSIISSVNVTADNENLDDAISIKKEMEDIDIYPTVLQRMDIHHGIHQPNMSVARQLSVIKHDHNYHALTSEVKEEIVEDMGGGFHKQYKVRRRDSDLCLAIKSLDLKIHKDRLKSICRVQLRRLQIFQCELCDTVYTENRWLLQHWKSVHGSHPQTSLFLKVNKRNKEQNHAAGTDEQQCVPATSTRAVLGRTNLVADSIKHGERVHIKEELEDTDLDIGPTVLQHMDSYYRTDQINMNGIKVETGMMQLVRSEPELSVKEKILKDDWQGYKTLLRKYCRQTTVKVDYDMQSCLDLQRHLLRQHRVMSSNNFKCNACGRIFHKPHLLSAHKELHQRNSNENSLTTESVVASSSNQSRNEFVKVKQKPLTNHIRFHTDEKPYSCDTRFPHKSHLTSHVKIHTGEILYQYQCNICNVRFAQRSHLNSHVRVHIAKKPYSCDKCDARFAHKSRLTAHVMVHTGEKPYQCNICNVRFANRSNLTIHMRVHTGEKPYPCGRCDAKFAQSGNLTSHMRLHSEKPYSCDTCGAHFAEISTLSNHMRTHTLKMLYSCDTCDARFPHKSHLISHVRIHTGEKPYQCNICNVRFADRSNLTSHMRMHTGEKPYPCGTGDKKFAHWKLN